MDLFHTNSLDTYINNQLYINYGDGSFQEDNTSVITKDSARTRGCAWADVDNDNDLDLFIANFGYKDNIFYQNQGNTQFEIIEDSPVIEGGVVSRSGCWGDFNNDGNLDLFVTNETYDFLFTNSGQGTFEKVINDPIVNESYPSVGASWEDYDNDGYLDLFVTTSSEEYHNFMYINNRNGSFSKIINEIPVEDVLYRSAGCIWSDYDNDGDIDLYIANGGEGYTPNFFYENNGNENNWINIKCTGEISNKSAIGTKVRIKATIWDQPIWQMREISSQTTRSTQNDMRAHFGLGDADIIDSLKIEWPSGIVQVFEKLSVNQFLKITESYNEYEDNQLIASYSLDGTANDESGNDLHGEVFGAVPTKNLFGIENKAFKFDGEDDFISINNSEKLDFTTVTPFTFSAWIKPDTTDIPHYIFSRARSQRPYDGIYFTTTYGWNDVNNIRLVIQSDPDNRLFVYGQTEMNLNEWYHVVATYEGSFASQGINLYINGIPEETIDVSTGRISHTQLASDIDWNIGSRDNNGDGASLNGLVDEVRIYNYVLSDVDVLDLYNSSIISSDDFVIEIPIVNSFPGDTINVPVNIKIPVFHSASALEIDVNGFQKRIEILGMSIENGILEENGWSISANETDTMLYFAAAGANEISESGTLFWLQFHVPDSLQGLVPVNIANAIIDTGLVNVVTRNGGVQVYKPLAGDVDLNYRIQAYDASMILNYLIDEIDLDKVQISNAEVSGDTSISALDASLILQYVVGNIDSLPVDTSKLSLLASGDLFMEDQQVNIGDELQIPIYLYDGQNIMSYQGSVNFDNSVLEYQSYELSETFRNISIKIKQNDGNLKLFAANSQTQDMAEGVIAYLTFKVMDIRVNVETDISIIDFQWNECDVLNESTVAKIQVVTSIEKSDPNRPKEFLLEQNYPNPFNPETSIRIHIPKSSEISLVIYDILGQRLKTLYQGLKPTGIYQFIWWGKNDQGIEMSTGTYILQLKSDQLTLNKKIQLIR